MILTKSDSDDNSKNEYLLEFSNPKAAKEAKADLQKKLDSSIVKIEYPFVKVSSKIQLYKRVSLI